MSHAILIILISATSIGFIHTLLGPDHYVPLIALAKARNWSLSRTSFITLISGIAHVSSAAVIGIVAASLGFAFNKLKFLESFRGSIAVWLLIGFGAAYFLWSLYRLLQKKEHAHCHLVAHDRSHCSCKDLTIWVVVLIFVLGPCEPLIPLILYPAIVASPWYVFLVTLLFGLGTIITMQVMVMSTLYGMKALRFSFIQRYGNVIAGLIICGCGIIIKIFGL